MFGMGGILSQRRLSLGLDFSTTGIKAILIDVDSREKVQEYSLDYRKDARLSRFGLNEDYILPPIEEGQANQPPIMYASSLDFLFSDLKQGINLGDIIVVNNSAQQHGHVYLNSNAITAFSSIGSSSGKNLQEILRESFAYDAPIWKTSDSGRQANEIRELVGGRRAIIELSGSDAPRRFTGPVIRRIAQKNPEAYAATYRIQLISSFIAGLLTGNIDAPIADGSGTLLMDYRKKEWSEKLLQAVADGLPLGRIGLERKLPNIGEPNAVVGTMAKYFVENYGFNPACYVLAGCGDNPQSKVLVSGDILSLGTSFVYMVPTDGNTFDLNGFGNSMYDAVGRPFIFVCRTNGANVLNRLRGSISYENADAAISQLLLNEYLFFWQPDEETLPLSRSFGPVRIGYNSSDLGKDYNGAVMSALAAVYLYSRDFSAKAEGTLNVTGGVSNSKEVLRRVAAFFKRPVQAIESGAALGAAIAGAYGYFKNQQHEVTIDDFTIALSRGDTVRPGHDDLGAIHGFRGFIQKFQVEYPKLII